MMWTGLKYVIAAVAVLLLASCAPKQELLSPDENFEPSSQNATELLARLRPLYTPVVSVSGRGRAQVSGPGTSERSTITFASDRNRTLLTFRNSLGIEGGRLLVEPDSVTFYNRIDQFAQRIGIRDQDIMLENGFYAVNMLSVLDPDIRERRARRAYENPDSWMIVFDDQSRMTFDRTTGNLTRYDMPMMHNLAFSTYLFGNHVRIAGYAMPQNIQILSNDRRTAVTIQVQSYEVNAAISELTLDIPAHIRIIRQ